MIIRKKNLQDKKSQNGQSSGGVSKKNVIKKEDLILDEKNAKNTNEEQVLPISSKTSSTKIDNDEEFEKIDISSIDFKERVERRRGDRRRGYRRIDERSLVSRAQAEAHSIKELASKEGYQNGLKKANQEIEELKTALIEFLSSKDKMQEEFYPHIMEISFEIAKKIIKQEVSMSQDIVKNIIKSTFDEINSDAQRITIKVNPDDVEFASVSLPEIIKEKNVSAQTSIMGDETIDRGSCIIIANNGVIDASFKTQLGILQSAFGIYKGGL